MFAALRCAGSAECGALNKYEELIECGNLAVVDMASKCEAVFASHKKAHGEMKSETCIIVYPAITGKFPTSHLARQFITKSKKLLGITKMPVFL